MKAAFSFARMNPMTTAHMMLVEDMSNIDCDRAFVYLSHSQDKLNKKDPLKNKNPLSYQDKICYAKAFVKEAGITDVEIVESEARTIMQALHEVNQNYDEVIIVCGSDRFDEYKSLIEKYNGPAIEGKEDSSYNFKNIEYHQVGANRDPDAEGAAGMSASKLRKLACEDNYEEFRAGVPTNSDDLAQDLYEHIRKAMLG